MGGVALGQTDTAGLSGWQTAGGTRPRRGVPSSSGTHGSVSSASTPIPRVDPYKSNATLRFSKIPAYVSSSCLPDQSLVAH